MNVVYLARDDPRYPTVLQACLGDQAPKRLAASGNLEVLDGKKLALVDGRVAYLGGINFSEHNFAWHDMMFRFEDAGLAGFLASRFLLRDWVQQRFGAQLAAINQGVKKEGAFYLFTLRLIPVIPFFAINLAMGLTPMRARAFYWVSQLGMLAGTIVYVNAGTQLAAIESPAGILSPGLIGAFVLLGIFPLVAKKIVDFAKARRVYARWAAAKPSAFDRNLVVIGAGSAGLVSAYIAAAVKAKVTLIERHRMGGDCLNTGCVPSKALIAAAKRAGIQVTSGRNPFGNGNNR
jgi:hypothetical protein